MTTVVGLLHLATAIAYLILMVIAVLEQRKPARVTPFSAALTVMFSGCGLHHAVHAEHALVFGREVSPLALPSLAVAAIPSMIFLALRFEALRGGRGDRMIVATPAWLGLVPITAALVSGAVLTPAIAAAARDGIDTPAVLANLVLFVTYSMAGWYLMRTQVARRPVRGGWSLSGISLAAIFPLCAFAHVVNSLVTTGDVHSLFVDLYQTPASIWFLWTVRTLHRRGRRELTRRPAVGRPSRTRRPSPWATKAPLVQRPA
jgi:hypothetical protein